MDVCRPGEATLYPEVNSAIEHLIATRPDLFDFTSERGVGGFLIRDPDQFTQAFLALMISRGFCASFDGEEFSIARSLDAFVEQYDLHLASSRGQFWLRRGPGAYRTTCGKVVNP
jgi:hypothetical protein